jgi:hypothetical protein
MTPSAALPSIEPTTASATTLAYLGTPYTRYGAGLDAAFEVAADLTARLTTAGLTVYSPIVHSHPLAKHGGLDPLDLSIWYPHNDALMARCDSLIVAHMDGWRDSIGIAYEIAYFKRVGKPIFDMNPATLTMVRRP